MVWNVLLLLEASGSWMWETLVWMLAFFLEDNKIPYLLLCLGVISCEQLFREIRVLLLLLIKKQKHKMLVIILTKRVVISIACYHTDKGGHTHCTRSTKTYTWNLKIIYIYVILMCTHRRNVEGEGEGLSTTQDHLGGGVGGSLAHFLGENMRSICYIYYDCNTSWFFNISKAKFVFVSHFVMWTFCERGYQHLV